MMGDAADRTDNPQAVEAVPSRATAIRHLVLGFGLLVTILLAAALCGLPR